MVFHMKTTLVIDDKIMRRLREEAARQNKTISQLVETSLRIMLEPKKDVRTESQPLPVFDLGGAYLDISDRDALYQAMEGR